MADKSLIEWTDATWPVVQGCDPVSPGCAHCYVPKELWRMAHNPSPAISGPLQGLAEKHKGKLRFTGKVALREDRLDWPLKWAKPRRIFVPSHGDLFHKDVPDTFIDLVFETMGACDDKGLGHQFQVLTKRAERQRDYVSSPRAHKAWNARRLGAEAWPPRNIWFGVSAERQQEADERIPHLLQTPAAVRFISAEPLLGPIDLTDIKLGHGFTYNALRAGDVGFSGRAEHWCALDWVIAGGESGADASPMHPQWARSLRDQCGSAGVRFFFKQWGEWGYFGRDLKFGEARDSITWGPNCEGGAEPYGSYLVGKKAAGRLLDGVEHNEFPN